VAREQQLRPLEALQLKSCLVKRSGPKRGHQKENLQLKEGKIPKKRNREHVHPALPGGIKKKNRQGTAQSPAKKGLKG